MLVSNNLSRSCLNNIKTEFDKNTLIRHVHFILSNFPTSQSQHCTENHIFFFQTSWKDGLSKKIALEYDLSCIMGKDDISFSRKYDLNPRPKMKDDFSQENARKYDIFFKCSEKMGCAGARSFLYYIGRWYFFLEITVFFPWTENERDDPSQDIHGNTIFSIWYVPRPLPKKIKDARSSKMHLKVIDTLDWHARKSSSNSLYLRGDLYRRFHILLSN